MIWFLLCFPCLKSHKLKIKLINIIIFFIQFRETSADSKFINFLLLKQIINHLYFIKKIIFSLKIYKLYLKSYSKISCYSIKPENQENLIENCVIFYIASHDSIVCEIVI